MGRDSLKPPADQSQDPVQFAHNPTDSFLAPNFPVEGWLSRHSKEVISKLLSCTRHLQPGILIRTERSYLLWQLANREACWCHLTCATMPDSKEGTSAPSPAGIWSCKEPVRFQSCSANSVQENCCSGVQVHLIPPVTLPPSFSDKDPRLTAEHHHCGWRRHRQARQGHHLRRH